MLTTTDGVKSDSSRYVPIAHNLRHGRWVVPPGTPPPLLPTDRVYPPLFPALMAVARPLCPDLVAAGQAVSLTAGLLLILVVYLLGCALRGPRAGVLASALTALSVPLTRSSCLVLTESCTALLLALTALLLVSARGRAGSLLLAGCALALAFLARPNAVAVAPAFALAIWLDARAAGRSSAPGLAALLGPVLLVIAAYLQLKAEAVASAGVARNEVATFFHALKLYGDPAAATFLSSAQAPDVGGFVAAHPGVYLGYLLRSYWAGVSALAGVIGLVPLALAALIGRAERRSRDARLAPAELALWLAPLIYPLVPALVINHVRYMPRMMIPVLPLLFVAAACSTLDAGARIERRARLLLGGLMGQRAGLLAGILAGVLVAAAAAPYAERVRQHTDRHREYKKPAWRAAGAWLRAHSDPGPILLDHPTADLLRAYALRECRIVTSVELLERARTPHPEGPRHALVSQLLTHSLLQREEHDNVARAELVQTFGDETYRCWIYRLP